MEPDRILGVCVEHVCVRGALSSVRSMVACVEPGRIRGPRSTTYAWSTIVCVEHGRMSATRSTVVCMECGRMCEPPNYTLAVVFTYNRLHITSKRSNFVSRPLAKTDAIGTMRHGRTRGAQSYAYAWSTAVCVEHGHMRGAQSHAWSTLTCVHSGVRGARCMHGAQSYVR